MAPSASVIALYVLLLGVTRAQAPEAPPLRPSPLEAFASQPAAKVTWSTEAGRIDSDDAHAVITALAVEDAAQPARRMRGIRITLSRRDARHEVYLEENRLPAFREALDEITAGLAHFQARHGRGGLSYLGSCEFRETKYPLTAAYYVDGSSGLAISPFHAPEFRFPGREPSHLAAAIARAVEELSGR